MMDSSYGPDHESSWSIIVQIRRVVSNKENARLRGLGTWYWTEKDH